MNRFLNRNQHSKMEIHQRRKDSHQDTLWSKMEGDTMEVSDKG